MTNIFTDVEKDLLKAGSFLLGVGKRAERIFVAEKALAPQAASQAVMLLKDVETVVSLAAPAVGSEGLNFAADSAAYAAFLQLVADAKAFGATTEQAIEAAEKAA